MTQKLSSEELNARKEIIVSAATDVFLRYGYARTAMADIAEAVGFSRAALYVIYSGKDEIFAAVIQRMSRNKLREFRAAFKKLRNPERMLHLCCEEWSAHGFDLVHKHPDARDLFNLAHPAVQEMYAEYIEFVAELLADFKPRLKTASLEELARNIVFSMRGLNDAAKSGTQMRRMISLQVDVFLAALTDEI